MQEVLSECIRVVSERVSRNDGSFEKALRDIHRLVFGVDPDAEEEGVKPSELLSSCEVAVESMGSHLGKRRHSSDAVRLPFGAVVVEVLARLARILLWDIAPPSEMTPRRRLKMFKDDGEELEAFLLPRFFLKLSVGPNILRDVLMRAPWSLFSRRYGTANAIPGGALVEVPEEVSTVLDGLKVNFGCDFLFRIRTSVSQSGSRAGVMGVILDTDAAILPTAVTDADTVSSAPVGDEEKDGDGTSRRSTKGHTRASTLEGIAPRQEPLDSVRGGRLSTLPFCRLQTPPSSHPRGSLPAYMLTKRKSGAMPETEVAGGYEEKSSGEANRASSSSSLSAQRVGEEEEGDVYASLEELSGETEILAPATPVKKRRRKDNSVVPPSPLRLTREEAIFPPVQISKGVKRGS